MRHSKLSPQYQSNYVHVYPTGLIQLSGKRDTETGTRYIDIQLDIETAREIQQTLNFSDEHNVPLGHAYWHIHNNDLNVESCSTCKYIHSK